HLPSVIPADDVDLPGSSNVTASRKAVHIGHVRTRGPRIGRNVVDAGDVVVGPAGSIYTAEHVNLVRRRIIDWRSHDRCLRHAYHRSPGVSTRVVTAHYRQGHP